MHAKTATQTWLPEELHVLNCVLQGQLAQIHALTRELLQALNKIWRQDPPARPSQTEQATTSRALDWRDEANSERLRRETKGSKIMGKMGIKVAGLGGQNKHQVGPCSHEICM